MEWQGTTDPTYITLPDTVTRHLDDYMTSLVREVAQECYDEGYITGHIDGAL